MLKRVNSHHSFSYSQIITHRTENTTALGLTDIILAIPSFFLEHLTDTQPFDCHHIQVVVVDEANLFDNYDSLNQIFSMIPEVCCFLLI